MQTINPVSALTDIVQLEELDKSFIRDEKDADIMAENIQNQIDGIQFELVNTGSRISAQIALIGEYNVSNCLAAAGACAAGLGLSWESIQQGISNLSGIPGRMERIDFGQDFLVVVDFAHTPNALKVAISAGRELTDSRVIAVFGSAGLRDKEKRRLMAEVSAELADLTVLTAEDPRTESLDSILEEMAAWHDGERGSRGGEFLANSRQGRGDQVRTGSGSKGGYCTGMW